jgi:DNA transposition AAA+ family ATPase
MISGPTGRSKTWTIDEFRHLRNHGRAVYVYAPEAGGFRAFLEALARSLNISSSRNNYALVQAIEHSLDERNVLIVDEVAHLYPTGRASSLQALEFIRGLHDRSGCGVILCATDGFEGILQGGRWAQWFDQLLGRIELHLRIPRQFSRQEIADLLAGYVDDPDPDLVNDARVIANGSTRGCRDLFRHLDRAAQVAADLKRPLSAEILTQTRDAANKLLTIDKE